jgi:acyl-CoA synthetase (AMP-forming)/AMP-acid ligase II
MSNKTDAAAAAPLQGEHQTIDQLLAAAAVQFAGREAYVEGSQRLTFDAWYRAADALAARFEAMGLGAGQVIAIQLPSSIDYAICCAATLLLGAVATGINTRLGPREVQAIIDRARPSLVITEDESRLPAGLRILPRAELAKLCAGPGLGSRRPPRQAGDPAVIVWTSGTTGVPKGVWYDHRVLAAAVRTAGVMTHAYDRLLPATPFAHAGYMSKLWDQVAHGVTTVIFPLPWTAPTMLRLLVDERITMAAGVPTQWAKLLQLPGLDAADLSSLRLCVSATAPASPELVEEIRRRLRCAVVGRYGMTECPSISGTLPSDDPQVIFCTVGRPATETQVLVTDDAGIAVPAGAVGRVRVKGPCVMRGYWGEPEMTRQALTPDGWLLTGDLGHFDPSGNLVLAGRMNDMYIRGGYNVYPLEVENLLVEHPAIAQAAVVGLKTPVIGEIGVAFVVPAKGQRVPGLAELRAFCAERLADYKAPDRLEVVQQLPLTPMMKIDKPALRAQLAAATGAGTAAA